MTPAKQPRSIPIKTCLACGCTWFREATLHQFLPAGKERYGDSGPEVGQDSLMPMTVVICLCDTPFRPSLGGIRGGHTHNSELVNFYRSFEKVEQRLRFLRDRAPLEKEAAKEFVAKDRLQDLRRVAADVEKKIGRLLAPREGDRSKRGGHWRLSGRTSATKAKGRDWLTLELQEIGLTFDEARAAVAAIFASMADRLKAGESIETPLLGKFEVVQRTNRYRRVRLGKIQTLHRNPKRVVFKPNPEFAGSGETKR